MIVLALRIFWYFKSAGNEFFKDLSTVHVQGMQYEYFFNLLKKKSFFWLDKCCVYCCCACIFVLNSSFIKKSVPLIIMGFSTVHIYDVQSSSKSQGGWTIRLWFMELWIKTNKLICNCLGISFIMSSWTCNDFMNKKRILKFKIYHLCI